MIVRAGALVGCLLIISGCGGESGSDESKSEPSASTSSAESPSPTSPPSEASSAVPPASSEPPAADGTTIVVGDSEFGSMLYDDTGQAIYLFDVETTSEPRCYDECAEAWPPVLTDGEPVADEGTDPDLLGTTERADGRLQVTYNGHPLYFYAHEGKNEVLCHDVFLNGGNWYVVQPGGDPAPPA